MNILNSYMITLIAFICSISAAQASHILFLSSATQTVYDANGIVMPVNGNTNVSGEIDLATATGYFTSTLKGSTWVADIDAIRSLDQNLSNPLGSFSWTTETWLIGSQISTCRRGQAINNCLDESLSGGSLLGSTVGSYNFTLTSNMLVFGTFFDWNGYEDIPILFALSFSGPNLLTFTTFDTDGDGVPGTAISVAPLLDKTIALSGRFSTSPVPIPAGAWLFISGLLGLLSVNGKRWF